MSYFMALASLSNTDSIGVCCPHLTVLVLVDLKYRELGNGIVVKGWPRINIMTSTFFISNYAY